MQNLYTPLVSETKSPMSPYKKMTINKVDSKNNYYFLNKIGSGGFGKVWKVREKNNSKKIFAMKEISKSK